MQQYYVESCFVWKDMYIMENCKATNVFVLENLPIVRYGIKSYLENQAGVNVIGEYDSLVHLLSNLQLMKPDVIIVGNCFSPVSETETVSLLLRSVGTKVVVIGDFKNWKQAQALLNAGVLGILSIHSSLSEINDALDTAADSKVWVSPCLRDSIPLAGKKGGDAAQDLSPRELQVASLVSQGMTSKQIGQQLCLSEKTVETHRYRIFRKLRIHHCVELTKYMMEHNLL
jgi:two-component system, NarL family, invasion response regulator UvrY